MKIPDLDQLIEETAAGRNTNLRRAEDRAFIVRGDWQGFIWDHLVQGHEVKATSFIGLLSKSRTSHRNQYRASFESLLKRARQRGYDIADYPYSRVKSNGALGPYYILVGWPEELRVGREEQE